MSLPDPTYSVHQVKDYCGRSVRWIQLLAAREGIGRKESNRLAFTRDEVERIKHLVDTGRRGNPNFFKKQPTPE